MLYVIKKLKNIYGTFVQWVRTSAAASLIAEIMNRKQNQNMESNKTNFQLQRRGCQVIVISAKTYHKNDFVNEALQLKGDSALDLHMTDREVREIPSSDGNLVFINLPGLYDTDPHNVEQVISGVEDYLKLHQQQRYTALVLVMQHPIRWTPEDREFMKVVMKFFGKRCLLENTSFILADYKYRDQSFEDFIVHLKKNYSSKALRLQQVAEPGDIIATIGEKNCYSMERIIDDKDYKSKLLNDLQAKSTFTVDLERHFFSDWTNQAQRGILVLIVVIGILVIFCICIGLIVYFS